MQRCLLTGGNDEVIMVFRYFNIPKLKTAMSNVLKISEAASLALHAMMVLASSGNPPLSSARIARLLHCSEAHLSKVLQRLVKSGLLRSVRGPKGGFALARPADGITLLDVYEAIEGPLEPTRCLLGTPVCDGSCVLGGLLQTVYRTVSQYLSETPLSRLAVPGGREPAAHEADSCL